MKNSFKYIKNIFKVLIWPIIFIIGQFFIQYIFVAFFNSKEKGTMTNNEFLNYISTIDYQNKLNNFINSNALLIIIITMILFVPIFYNVFKKYKRKSSFKFKDIFIPILFGISISLIFNILLFNINNIIYFTDKFELSNLNVITQLICSGICGPILEELLFRGIVYNKLKEFNKPIIAIIITSIIFGLMHFDFINAIYGFGVSFILIYLYEKHKTLKATIIMHISLNVTIILMSSLITRNFTIFNLYLLIVSILILLILKIFIKKDV